MQIFQAHRARKKVATDFLGLYRVLETKVVLEKKMKDERSVIAVAVLCSTMRNWYALLIYST
jgi:hypothetical protein